MTKIVEVILLQLYNEKEKRIQKNLVHGDLYTTNGGHRLHYSHDV